jgi:hypothetical protein
VTTTNKVRARPGSKPRPKAPQELDIVALFKPVWAIVRVADQAFTFDNMNVLYQNALKELDSILQKNGGKENRRVYVHVLVAKLKVYRNWCSHLEWVEHGRKQSHHDNLVAENIQPLADEIAPFLEGKRGLYTIVRSLYRQIGDVSFLSQPFKPTADEVIEP